MGRKIAFELLMLCENITPQRAYELGLVNRVVPDGQQLETALGMAEVIAKWNPEFVGQTKRTFHRAAGEPAIIVTLCNADPVFMALALDKGLAGLAPRLERIEFLLQPLLR